MMFSSILKQNPTIRTAVRDDRQRIANLIHFESQVHRHLDWRAPLDWLGETPYLLLEQRKNLVAALACPPDPPPVAWIRLYAVVDHYSNERAWEMLWGKAREQFQDMPDVSCAAALSLFPWFSDLLAAQHFAQENKVVMLNWEGDGAFTIQCSDGIVIRPMNFDDIAEVQGVDHAAFSLIWQNSRQSLELAYRQASVATVAESQGVLVGYQISTATPLGGHLARLAVHPACQGTGIGQALLQDLLTQFRRRGAQRVTVNTQKDNASSLKLYQKCGFYLTGEEYPVFIINLK